MYTPSAPVYRATVTYSNTSTGQIIVRIPALTGANSVIELSKIGRSSSNNTWIVPQIGEQIIVTADDANFTNTFWLQTDPYNAGTKEPTGFAERLDSAISFTPATHTFTIAPVDGSYEVWVRGVKYVITDTRSISIPNVSGSYYFYYDTGGVLKYKTSPFDLTWEATIAYLSWRESDGNTVFFADERHGIVMDSQTHEYLHRTHGAQYANGFDIATSTLVGTGTSATHLQISITDGAFFDEDLEVSIVNSAVLTLNNWDQRLFPIAYIPVFYKNTVGWERGLATNFPLLFATTGGLRPVYNSISTPTVPLVEIGANKYGISWIVATNNIAEPIICIMGQEEYSNISGAEDALWDNVTLTGFPGYEFRPLYKVIFQALNAEPAKGAIRELMDLRLIDTGGAVTGIALSSLTNLADVAISAPVANQYLYYNGLEWVNSSNPPQTFNPKSASYILLASDAGKVVNFTNSSPTSVVVTVNGSTDLEIGQRIDLLRYGTGAVSVAGSGVNLYATPGYNLRDRYSAASILCVATDTYVLIGDLAV